MIHKTIYQEVAVDVCLGLTDFDDNELIEEIEDRGLYVLDQDDSGAMSQAAKDEIYELYRDFVIWDNKQIPDSIFILALKKFFSEQLDKNVL